MEVGVWQASYVMHMSENICLWEEAHLDPFTLAWTVEQGSLWGIFPPSFLLVDFIWRSWKEMQKLSSAPCPILANSSCSGLLPCGILFSNRNKQTK